MAFACCPECGAVSLERRGVPPQYGRAAGRCPECSSTTYWTATPLARELVKRRMGPRDVPLRHDETARHARVDSP